MRMTPPQRGVDMEEEEDGGCCGRWGAMVTREEGIYVHLVDNEVEGQKSDCHGDI
jgi:hypothetical protein